MTSKSVKVHLYSPYLTLVEDFNADHGVAVELEVTELIRFQCVNEGSQYLPTHHAVLSRKKLMLLKKPESNGQIPSSY